MDTQHSIAAREAASNTKSGIVPDSIRLFDQLPDSALLGSDAVRGLVGEITSVTLWRWIKAGHFPAPKKLPGGRLNSWRVADVRKFLQAQEADHAPA